LPIGESVLVTTPSIRQEYTQIVQAVQTDSLIANPACLLYIFADMTPHEQWMKHALREAEAAFEEDEIPVGAIVVHENRIIGRGHNQIERMQDATAHAEMIAITAASEHLHSRRLEGCTLYVTLEPCPMCAGATVLARIPTLVFGSFDPKAGACGTLYNLTHDRRLNHTCHVISGVSDIESEELLKRFLGRVRTARR